MEAFISRRRPKFASTPPEAQEDPPTRGNSIDDDEESTDLKLATLFSLFPTVDQATLLDLLISADGSVEAVSGSLSGRTEDASPSKRSAVSLGYQTSLSTFRKSENAEPGSPSAKRRALTRKGQTLHLYAPEDIANYTPCSIIHNFLPAREADNLLRELLEEATTFERQNFKLFDNVVQSPHSACFYVESLEERERQKTEYLYNGSYLKVSLPSRLFVETDRSPGLPLIGCPPDYTSVRTFRSVSFLFGRKLGSHAIFREQKDTLLPRIDFLLRRNVTIWQRKGLSALDLSDFSVLYSERGTLTPKFAQDANRFQQSSASG